jgi:hemin uptake protein HemP
VASIQQPDDRDQTPPSTDLPPVVSIPPVRQLTSEELFAGRHEIEIRHDGESYRLRITRNGKLILHK